jgi:hypothetical protein
MTWCATSRGLTAKLKVKKDSSSQKNLQSSKEKGFNREVSNLQTIQAQNQKSNLKQQK